MWMEITESKEGTFAGSKLSLEAAVYCTKDEFPEQLLLGQMEEIKQGMVATISAVEEFLLAAERERSRLLRQIEVLRKQVSHSVRPSKTESVGDHRLN